MKLVELARASILVASAKPRNDKVRHLADTLRALQPEERRFGTSFLSGELWEGRIGLGPATVRKALSATPPAANPSLSLSEVADALTAICRAKGPGALAARQAILQALLARATEEERRFFVLLSRGELRQGAQEGVLVDAVARAAAVPATEVRRAAMMAGSLPAVAEAALKEGSTGLSRFRLRVLEPVSPMLADSAEDLETALADLGRAGLEWKLDGARVQVHRSGDEVRVFSRSLKDVTNAVPEVVKAVRALPARTLLLDGEAIALGKDRLPEPFQVTMRRFGLKRQPSELAQKLPLSVFFFDVLHADGEDLDSWPGAARAERLAALVPEELRVPRIVTADPALAKAFFEDALRRGHEGVMAKSLTATYEAGRRGAGWLKVKRAHTLDLVVLAVEPGSGRRRGWLSNLHLGAREVQSGGFVMLGKTFKGMTDDMLRWQTERLRELAVFESVEGRGETVVHVRPELVVEVAFDGIQASPRYPAGMTLRFARLKRYREDKRADEADTLDTIRALYARQFQHAEEV